MTTQYPDDSDGDALRRVASTGSDMTLPMEIEFPVVIADEELAKKFSLVAARRGFKVHLWKHDDDPDWDVVCAIEMIPTYDDVVRIQRELTSLAAPYRGCCDSWGTFGNKDQRR